MRHSTVLLPLVLSVLLLLGGCSSYRPVGPSGTADLPSLFVAPIENATLAPQVHVLLSRQIREALLQRGFGLENDRSRARRIVEISLDRFDREALARQDEDPSLARSFALRLGARLTLTDVAENRLLVDDQAFLADAQSFVDGGLIGSEDQEIGALSRELSRKIANAVLAAWEP